jgi:hypothetical protein
MEVRRLIAAGSGPLATCRERVAAGLALPDRWAYVTTALFSALLFSAAAYRIAAGPQAYPDLIVGNLAWAATTKRQDYAALLGLLGGFAIALPFLLALAGWARSRRGAAAAASLHHLLAMASVPAFIWVGSIALRSVTDLHLLVLGGVLTTLTALVATIAIVRPDGVPPDDFRDGVAASVCIVVLSAAMPFVVALVVGRAGPWLHWRPIDVHAWTGPALPVGLASVALVFVIVVWSPLSRTPQKVRRRLQIALRAVQAPALLFFLAIIPVPWQGDQNLAASVRPSTRLWLLVVLFLTVGLIDLWRRTDAGSGKWFDAALSPAVALSVLVILGSPDVGVAAIPKDDFHFGEFLTPFWAWRQHALIPYWDYAPARGLTNYTSGLMSAWLFDGSAASLQTAQSVSRVLYWAITVPILARPLGVIGALIASLLMAPPNGYSEVDTLVTAGLVIVVQTYLTRRPATFLGVWGLVGTALVLIAPGQGGLLVLATLPLGTPAIVAAWSSDRRRLIRVLLGSLGAALGLLAGSGALWDRAGSTQLGGQWHPLGHVRDVAPSGPPVLVARGGAGGRPPRADGDRLDFAGRRATPYPGLGKPHRPPVRALRRESRRAHRSRHALSSRTRLNLDGRPAGTAAGRALATRGPARRRTRHRDPRGRAGEESRGFALRVHPLAPAGREGDPRLVDCCGSRARAARYRHRPDVPRAPGQTGGG